MSLIQVFKHDSDSQIGKGTGIINKDETAQIDKWTDKAALSINAKYKLKSGGKIYPNANCTNNVLPVTFNNVI